MYDIIGDIHGHADELEALLDMLGHGRSNGSYRRADRLVIFLGDFIDCGPHQQRVVNIV